VCQKSRINSGFFVVLGSGQWHPDEPKQLRPGEDITVDDDGKVSVRGQIAVMAVNESLFQNMLQKNPGMTFGLEESYPLRSTYADAAPLGPILELRASDAQGVLTADNAAQSLAYWENTAQQLRSEPDAAGQEWTKAYAKMAAADGNLFAAHGLNEQAEQAYSLALQINPSLPETVFGYVSLLQEQNRAQDALAVAQAGAQAAPNNTQLQALVRQLSTSQPATSSLPH